MQLKQDLQRSLHGRLLQFEITANLKIIHFFHSILTFKFFK